MTSQLQLWPAWWYGPDDAAEIFNSEEEVPQGWVDHPSKVLGRFSEAEQVNSDESVYKTFGDDKIIAELKLRNIEYGARWPRAKLEGLLLADDKTGAGK